MTDLNNVYQSTQVDYEPEGADEMELASPGKRIAAYLINCLIGAVAYIPMIWGAVSMSGSYAAAMDPENPVQMEPSGFAMGMIGLGSVLILAYLIFQAV